jgi:hypothetical protein
MEISPADLLLRTEVFAAAMPSLSPKDAQHVPQPSGLDSYGQL